MLTLSKVIDCFFVIANVNVHQSRVDLEKIYPLWDRNC